MKAIQIKSNLFKNIITLISGTAIAQVVAVLFQLLTRRLFSPEDYGTYAVYFSIISILIIVSTLQLNRAIVLPKTDIEASRLASLGIQLSIIINFVIFLLFILAGKFIMQLLNFPVAYKFWFYFIPVHTSVFATFQMLNFWLIRKKEYKASSIAKVIRRTSEGTGQVGFSYILPNSGLFLGDFFGQVANLSYTGFKSIKSGFKLKMLSVASSIKLLKAYSDFPKYSTLPMILNSISLFIPVFFVNFLFSSKETGQLDISRMILALPLALISNSVYQVILQHVAESYKSKESIKGYLLKIMYSLLTLALIGLFLFYFLNDFIFRLFGNQWEQAIQITVILMFSYSIKFVVSPLSAIFISLNKVKIGALWQVLNFTLLLGLLLIDYTSLLNFIKILVLIELISYSLYLLLIFFTIKNYEQKIA
jgi:O-antigen/teichoic acid export membrane protein